MAPMKSRVDIYFRGELVEYFKTIWVGAWCFMRHQHICLKLFEPVINARKIVLQGLRTIHCASNSNTSNPVNVSNAPVTI